MNHDFNAPLLNQKWCIDITQLYADGKKLYMCAIIDLYDRLIVGHSISDRENMSLVKNALEQANVKNQIKPSLGAVRLCELQPHDVQRFINGLLRGKKPLSSKTIKNVHDVLCMALFEAVRIKYITTNPGSGCILPKVIREEIYPFEAEEVSALMDAIQGNPSEAIFFVALNTCMRLSEILGLRWNRVDFKKGMIKVDAQLLVKRGKESWRELGLPKNSKPRPFKPAPAVMDVLRAVEHQQKEWCWKTGPAWNNALGLVFTNKIGKEIPHATVEHRFSRVLESAGIEAHRFHDLRQSFTVESLRAGVDVKTVSEMLGHSSVSFTLDAYDRGIMLLHLETPDIRQKR